MKKIRINNKVFLIGLVIALVMTGILIFVFGVNKTNNINSKDIK